MTASLRRFFRLSIIDKYLIKNYLTTVFYLIFLFIVISVAIDYSEKTDNFANPDLSKKQIVGYYLAFVPHIINLLLPIFVFIATVLFTSKLAGKTEFIPMFSSGISLLQILKPYFFGSVLIATIAWFANFELIPYLNKKKAAFLIQYVDGRPPYTSLNNYSMKVDSNVTLELKSYNVQTKIATEVSFYENKNSHLTSISRADSMVWDTLRNVWLLKHLMNRKISSLGHTISYQDSTIFRTFLQPNDLSYDFYLKEKLSTSALKTKIAQEELKGSGQINQYKIEYYKRDATPFSIIILSLIAAIISSKKIRGGSGIHLAVALLISAIYVVLDRFSTVFSVNSGLSPLLAAWLPNIIFLFVTFYFYKKSQQ